jgi:hypothetical protein
MIDKMRGRDICRGFSHGVRGGASGCNWKLNWYNEHSHLTSLRQGSGFDSHLVRVRLAEGP